MKNPKIGDFLLWKGEPAKIIGTADKKVAVIELIEDQKCPHCGKILGKERFYEVIESPLFQKNAEKMPTIEEEKS